MFACTFDICIKLLLTYLLTYCLLAVSADALLVNKTGPCRALSVSLTCATASRSQSVTQPTTGLYLMILWRATSSTQMMVQPIDFRFR